MVIGGLGVGKSTLLNGMIGDAENSFVTSNKPRGCTQEASSKQFMWNDSQITVIDTPGLFDLRMPLPIWLSRYNKMPKS